MNRPTLQAAALASGLLACAPDTVLEHRFAGSRLPSVEELARLEALPPGLRVLPDGRWAVELEPRPDVGPLPAFRIEEATLLVPIDAGAFEARVPGVQGGAADPGVVLAAPGVVVAAVARGRLTPGASLIAVRVRDGLTRTVETWRMPADRGHLRIEEMELSPDGRRVACQLVEMHPRKAGGFEEAARRGVVLATFHAIPPTDLGPEVRGPMRWSVDGDSLYHLRDERDGVALVRLTFPSLAVDPPPRASAPEPQEPPSAADLAGSTPAEADAGPGRSVRGGAVPAAAPVDRTVPPTAPAHRAAPAAVPVDRAALIDLIVRLSGDAPPERLAAARALATMPDSMAIGPLISAMERQDPELCRVAAGSLRALLPGVALRTPGAAAADECGELAEAWRDWWTENPDALAPKTR